MGLGAGSVPATRRPGEVLYAEHRSESLQRRYAKIQVAGFIASCGAMLLYGAAAIDAMTELSVEIVLLFYRGINEAVHGEWDASAYWHHGGFLLVFILLKNVDVWREQYASAAVMMQVLHFPMTLWYVGGRAHCISKSPQTRHVSVVLFRPIWIASCAFRGAVLLLAAVHAADEMACGILFTCAAVFMALDWYWTGCFLNRVSAPSRATAVLAGMVGVGLALLAMPLTTRRPLFSSAGAA